MLELLHGGDATAVCEAGAFVTHIQDVELRLVGQVGGDAVLDEFLEIYHMKKFPL